MSTKVLTAYKDSVARQLADLALKNKLYVSGWMLSEMLLDIRTKPDADGYGISVVLKDKIPVSVAIARDNETISAFTRKALRRNGFGTKAVMALKEVVPGVSGHTQGIDGSTEFFSNCGLPLESMPSCWN